MTLTQAPPLPEMLLPPLPAGFTTLSAAEIRVMHALVVLGACGYPSLRAETRIPDKPLRGVVKSLEFRSWVRQSRKGGSGVVRRYDRRPTGFAHGFEQVIR